MQLANIDDNALGGICWVVCLMCWVFKADFFEGGRSESAFGVLGETVGFARYSYWVFIEFIICVFVMMR